MFTCAVSTVERSWLRLHLDWGDNVMTFFKQGIEDGHYNPQDPEQLFVKLLLMSGLSSDCQPTANSVSGSGHIFCGPTWQSR
jgi:hypothetical protein